MTFIFRASLKIVHGIGGISERRCRVVKLFFYLTPPADECSVCFIGATWHRAYAADDGSGFFDVLPSVIEVEHQPEPERWPFMGLKLHVSRALRLRQCRNLHAREKFISTQRG